MLFRFDSVSILKRFLDATFLKITPIIFSKATYPVNLFMNKHITHTATLEWLIGW